MVKQMTKIESLVVRFVRWNYHLEEGDFTSNLAPDFVFDDGFASIPRDEYIAVQRGYGVVDGLAIRDLFASGDRAAVMFEGVDSVTGLFHRYCWMVVVDELIIRRVMSCTANLLPPEERPIWK